MKTETFWLFGVINRCISASSVLLVLTCCSPPRQPQTVSVNYEAIVAPPQGTLSFKDVTTLQAFTANDTALTQSDAKSVATLGMTIGHGTRLRVVSQAGDPNLARKFTVSYAQHDCLVKQSDDDTDANQSWVECADLVKVGPKRTTSDAAVLTLGATDSAANAALTGDRPTYLVPDENGKQPDDQYDVHVASHVLRLSPSFASTQDGSKLLAQEAFNVGHDAMHGGADSVGSHTDLSEFDAKMRRAVIAYALPHDAVPMNAADVGMATALIDKNREAGEDIEFFNSASLSKNVRRSQWFDALKTFGWKSGICPNAIPGAIELQQKHNINGKLVVLIATSDYLNYCQESF